ncbi:hypothetical protein DFH11DRAFT_862795 [Phellopilus nigrolimitatus]|nr:hypothetical protein DFH11DRAFT_862795 [Phellopilus nigrolimitatus]
MAPYTPFNHTPVSSRSLPLPTYGLLPPHSLYKADASYPMLSVSLASATPSTTVSNLHAAFRTARPYLGVGPAIMPTPFSLYDAPSSTSSNRSSSPKLGYIGILGVLIVLVLLVFVLVRRYSSGHRRQRPANYPAPRTLRSETARARQNAETGVASQRTQLLPRDIIRAMNTVPKASFPTDPPPYSAPPTSPPPRALDNAFSSLDMLSPDLPYRVPSQASAESASCPPTPTIPTTPLSTEIIEPGLPSPSSEEADMRPEVRPRSWDFRCRGLYRFSFGLKAVLDISPANSLVSATTTLGEISSSVDMQKVSASSEALANDSHPDASGKTLPGNDLSMRGSDSASQSTPGHSCNFSSFSILTCNTETSLETTSSTIFESSPQGDLESKPADPKASFDRRHIDHTPLLAGTTIRGLDLDLTPFHIQVIDSRPPSAVAPPTGLVVEEVALVSDSDLMNVPDPCNEIQYTDGKPAKKRFILSTPKHRTLVPSSSSLKLRASPSSAGLAGSNSASQQLSSFSHEIAKSTMPVRARMSKFKAASEVDLAALGRAVVPSLSPLSRASGEQAVLPTLNGDATLGGIVVESGRIAKGILRSSLSMPLCVELACLASITRRYCKPKFD